MGNTVHGRQVIRSTAKPAVPLKPDTQDDGTVLDLQAQEDALRAKHEAEAQKLRDNETFPNMTAARKAAEALRANAEVWDKDRLAAGWKRVKKFVQQNPEAVEAFAKDKARREWTENTIDTTPHASSRLRKAQAEAAKLRWSMEDDGFAATMVASEMFPNPKSVKDLPPVAPDSRLGILESQEQAGLDTSSGYGGLGDTISAAMEFNSPRARAAWLYGATMDKLTEAGIELPEGVLPVQLNEELGQLEYLNPTEDGKLRRTLVEGEFFRMADVGNAADLPELLSMIGATAAAVSGPAGRHPFITELAGDTVGRNLGTYLEYLMSSGEVTKEELQSAFAGNFSDSAVATMLSRGTARVLQGVGNAGSIKVGGREGAGEAAEQTAQEAGDVMEAINDINKGTGAAPLTLERGSLSLREAQKARGREKTLSKNARDALEEMRTTRTDSIGRANQRIAEGQGAAPGPTDSVSLEIGLQQLSRTGQIATSAPVRVSKGVDRIKYSYVGEVDAAAPVKGGLMGENGVEVLVDHNTGTVYVENVFEGQNFRGRTYGLLQQMLDDVPADYSIRSSVAPSDKAKAMIDNLNKDGWVIKEVDDGTGAFELIARPGEIVAPDAVARAEFSQAALENDLEQVASSVPVLESMVGTAQARLQGVIKWSPQRHTSGYSVENKSSSGVRTTVRRIQNRIQQSLTGTEANEANRALNAAVREEADDEGNSFLTGLAGEELDLGNLINAREAVERVAEKTGDPDLARLTTDIDNLLKNAAVYTEKGNKIAASTRGNIYNAVTEYREASRLLNEQTALVNGNQMFAQGPDGTFINSSLKQLRLVLGNSSRYIKHMKPLMEGSPGLQARASDALNSIYKADVMEKGWTKARHDAFMSRYGDSAKDIMHPDDLAVLADIKPPAGGLGRFERIERQRADRWNNLQGGSILAKAQGINPDNILGSLEAMGAGRARTFMYYAEKHNPVLAKRIKQDMAAQIRNDLHKGFFDVSRGKDKLGSGFKLEDWFNADNGKRRRIIKEVMGTQYEKDLKAVVRAHAIDAKRTAAEGFRPESQGDIIRITRSLLGPLSRPQRQITAFNYVRQRTLAKKVLNIMSDPDQLRALNAQGKLPANSRAGVAALTRLGIFEAAGIEDPENNPEGVQEFYGWLDEMARIGLEDQKGE